jgi:hypothetical protein
VGFIGVRVVFIGVGFLSAGIFFWVAIVRLMDGISSKVSDRLVSFTADEDPLLMVSGERSALPV